MYENSYSGIWPFLEINTLKVTFYLWKILSMAKKSFSIHLISKYILLYLRKKIFVWTKNILSRQMDLTLLYALLWEFKIKKNIFGVFLLYMPTICKKHHFLIFKPLKKSLIFKLGDTFLWKWTNLSIFVEASQFPYVIHVILFHVLFV